jgi:hypothetical protein
VYASRAGSTTSMKLLGERVDSGIPAFSMKAICAGPVAVIV